MLKLVNCKLTILSNSFHAIFYTLISHADKWGRKKTLLLSSFLAIITSIIFAISSNFYVLLISAIVGVISPSGNEIRPFMAIELSGLVQVRRIGDDSTLE